MHSHVPQRRHAVPSTGAFRGQALHRAVAIPAQPDVAALQRLQGLEAQGLIQCQQEMSDLRQDHALWFSEFEDIDPDTADVEDVLSLLQTAPSGFAKGLIFGKFTLRMQLAAVTGRGF